jgi:AcrR family transcriptional regulator
VKFPVVLARRVEEVAELFRAGEATALETHYKAGTLGLEIMAETAYGEAGVRDFARRCGVSRNLIYRCAAVVRAFPRAQLDDAVNLARGAKYKLGFSLLADLAPQSANEREELLDLAINRRWSTEDLRRELRCRHPAPSSGVLAKLTERVDTLAHALDRVQTQLPRVPDWGGEEALDARVAACDALERLSRAITDVARRLQADDPGFGAAPSQPTKSLHAATI